MSKISVLIATRNRASMLNDCLQSLAIQKTKPYEIIVVDNNSIDQTKKIINKYTKDTPIIYVYEENIGLPYCRNTAIKHAKGDVLAFIDDDCEATMDWLTAINLHFKHYAESQGVIGFTNNFHTGNPCAEVEQIFYTEWLYQNLTSINSRSLILDGKVIDFKNCAFRKTLIQSTPFSTIVPFGDVGNEDVEVGDRLYKKSNLIYFDPNMIVYHKNTINFLRLVQKNFWKGYADEQLLFMNINTKNVPIYRAKSWLLIATSSIHDFKSPQEKAYLLFLAIIYPIFSKLGRLYAFLLKIICIKKNIPQRS